MNRVELTDRQDFTLANFAAVTRGGAAVALAPEALRAMDRRRRAFLEYLDGPQRPWIYNVSGRLCDGKPLLLSTDERRLMAQRPILAGAVLEAREGSCLPERIVRGIIFCRLTNCIEGHAGVRSEVATAVARMLQAPLPPVPATGHGAAGEMLLLSHTFGALIESLAMQEKEASALVNGAPTAAALLADAALLSGQLLQALMACSAQLIAAFAAPAQAYDAALAELWGGPMAAGVNRYLHAAADQVAADTPGAQAPLSFRAAPRLLARAVDTMSRLQRGAERALRAVTDNPLILDLPEIRTLGNGGFFDADAPALFDQMAGEFADLTRLLERMATRVVEVRMAAASASAQFRLRSLVSALAGYAEDTAGMATRTALPASEGGGAPQNDLVAPVLQAWNKFAAVADRAASAAAAVNAVSSPERVPQAAELRQAMYGATSLPEPLRSIYW